MNKENKEVVETEELEMNAEQFNKARRKATATGGAWKFSIVEYLKEHQGSDDLTIFNATRPDALDRPDGHKKKSVASEFTYLRDIGYLDVLDNGKRYLVAQPGKKPKTFVPVPGQEARFKRLL